MIGLASVAMSLVALELGARLGTRLGERAELLSGSLLIAVGVAIAAGAL
jgi:putative Mn2+ efflux pump MntP